MKKKNSRNICDFVSARQYHCAGVNFFEEPQLNPLFHVISVEPRVQQLYSDERYQRVIIPFNENRGGETPFDRDLRDVASGLCESLDIELSRWFALKTIHFHTHYADFFWVFVVTGWNLVQQIGQQLNADFCYFNEDLEQYYLDHKIFHPLFRFEYGEKICAVYLKTFYFKTRNILNNKYNRYVPLRS